MNLCDARSKTEFWGGKRETHSLMWIEGKFCSIWELAVIGL